ncbi:MAG: alpha/beta hydrolase, partial [Pseudomonadota bacterium]|nr:alpha/beta hydrolase [Pseudomonadota bacterium]
MGVIEQSDMLLDSGLGHGTRLLLRNKRLLDGPSSAPSLLFVHGATYAASLVFDYDIDGQWWMDRWARAGFEVWCVDLPGYGGAERPSAMADPAADH